MPGLILALATPLLAAVAVMASMTVLLVGAALGRDSFRERTRRTHTR